MSYQVDGWLEIGQFRNIVDNNKPFDTGRMLLEGTRYVVNPEYQKVSYDTLTLPYIIFQEKGFTHWITGERVEVNKGFISVNTLTELAQVSAYQDAGVTNERTSHADANRARVSMISNGVIDRVKGYGAETGGRGDVYVGR